MRTDVAQAFPFGVVVISDETISQKLNGSSAMYAPGDRPRDSWCFSGHNPEHYM